jgi:hypothetical protein
MGNWSECVPITPTPIAIPPAPAPPALPALPKATPPAAPAVIESATFSALEQGAAAAI